MKKNLLILFGGCSSEYEVSLHSAAAVMRAVDPGRYEVVKVGITRMGQWLYFEGGADEVAKDSWVGHPSCIPAVVSPSREDHGLWLMRENGCERVRVDLCLPVLHGPLGEDGTVQGLLELAGIPIVGCGCLTSALCMDKDLAHRLAQQAGIACPRFVAVRRDGTLEQQVHRVLKEMQDIPFPWYVKPACAGSSFGVSRIEGPGQLPAAMENAFRYDNKVVVEEGISGFEVGCALLGGHEPFIGAVDAIQLNGGFFDFHEKYTLDSARILLPAPVDAAAEQRIKETALMLWRLFGCDGFARVDMFLTEDGEVVFNEINTIPGMTEHSRFPGMLRQAGLSFEAMVSRMLEQTVVK